MKINVDINLDLSYTYDNLKQLVNNDDIMKVARFLNNVKTLCDFYKDKKSFDLACRIAESIEFQAFLQSKHPFEDLLGYYYTHCCYDNEETAMLDEYITNFNYDDGEEIFKLPEKNNSAVKCNN